MLRYVATINVPGYSPMDDEPAVFDSAQEAWAHLVTEREHDEEMNDDSPEFSQTVETLRYIASDDHQHGNPREDWPTNPDGSGFVYAGTPGSDSAHDLGLCYAVTAINEEV